MVADALRRRVGTARRAAPIVSVSRSDRPVKQGVDSASISSSGGIAATSGAPPPARARRHRARRNRHDHALGHAAQPGLLPLGELAGRGDAALGEGVQRAVVEVRPRSAGSRRSASTAGPASGRPALQARTSSTRPSASIWRKRCAMRGAARRSVGSSAINGGRGPAGAAPGRGVDSGRPLTRQTSSARWMRCASLAQARRGRRIDAAQFVVQGLPGPVLGGLRPSMRGAPQVGGRHLVEAVEQA